MNNFSIQKLKDNFVIFTMAARRLLGLHLNCREVCVNSRLFFKSLAAVAADDDAP